ncbi:MAG: hypothetical protein AAGD22_03485 [Verrucomicrobiota bacterium]
MKRRTIINALFLLVVGLVQGEEQTKLKPELDGQPVYQMFGMIVVHPKGVEDPPNGYEGAMRGTAPLAIIKSEGRIVGEVYGNPLQGKAKDEAEGMRGSADDSPMIDLVRRASAKRTNLDHEITTLRMKAPSKLGNPWILHSLYFPKGDRSVTFKFVAGEQNFGRVLPIFEAMLFAEEFMKPPEERTTPDAKK